MRGYLRRGGKASWEVTVELGTDPVTGRRLRRTVSVKGTKRQAEDELSRLTNALVTGSYIDPGRETVGTFLERWLRDYAKANVAPRTYDRYAEMVRGRIIPALGSTRLTALRPSHLVAAEQSWREALAPSSVLKYHRLMHKALRDAVKWQTLAVNPVDAVTPPRAPRREMTALDAGQAAALLDAARGHEYETPLLTAVYTGLRLGELLGLR